MSIESPLIKVNIFENAQDYDRFLDEHNMESGFGHRAKGKKRKDGSLVVVIDQSYYLSGGIKPSQLPAIVEHERIELTSESADPHLEATIGEYRMIADQFGIEELIKYHSNLCNLIGGTNEFRIKALNEVLGRE